MASNRAMSAGDEITLPTRQIGLSATAIRVQQQAAIAAAHHGEAEPDQACGLIAEFVRNPVPVGNRVIAEQGAGDLAMGGAGKPPVEPAQGEDETIAPGWREGSGIGTGISPLPATWDSHFSPSIPKS